MAVSHHRILVDPKDCPQTLNALRLVILYEIANVETFILRLHESVMTLCGASCSATCRTDCSGFIAHDWVATRTFKLHEVKSAPITQIEVLIDLVPWRLHVIENVEAPINRMMVVRMLV